MQGKIPLDGAAGMAGVDENGTRLGLFRGDVASTGIEPQPEIGLACCDCQPNLPLPDTRHAAECAIYKKPILDCRGSYLQNTACKACLRCTQEKSMLLRNYRLGYWTSAEMADFEIDISHVEPEER